MEKDGKPMSICKIGQQWTSIIMVYTYSEIPCTR